MRDRHHRILATLLVVLVLSSAVSAEIFLVDPQYSVSVTRNVSYGTSANGDGVQLQRLLDVYQPVGANLPDKLPGVVLMHGGFFASGSKSNMSSVARAFASRGYVATSINYRLLGELADPPGALPPAPEDRWPAWLPNQLNVWDVTIDQYLSTIAAAVADLGMSVNWLADNADTYNIDSSKIVVGGFSAGATSSLMLGFGAIDGVDADVAAVVSFAGGLFGSEGAIDSDDPPTLIVHGTADSIVPFTEYEFLQAALDDAGVTSEAIIQDGVGHSLNFDEASIQQAFSFLRTQLIPEPSSFLLSLVGCGIVSIRRRR